MLFPTFYGRGRCCIICPVLCVSISLAPDRLTLFIQQSIVGFDEFMKVQAGRHADVFVVISQ